MYTLHETNTYASLKRNRLKNMEVQLFEYSVVGLYCGSAQMMPLNRDQKYLSNGIQYYGICIENHRDIGH